MNTDGVIAHLKEQIKRKNEIITEQFKEIVKLKADLILIKQQEKENAEHSRV